MLWNHFLLFLLDLGHHNWIELIMFLPIKGGRDVSPPPYQARPPCGAHFKGHIARSTISKCLNFNTSAFSNSYLLTNRPVNNFMVVYRLFKLEFNLICFISCCNCADIIDRQRGIIITGTWVGFLLQYCMWTSGQNLIKFMYACMYVLVYFITDSITVTLHKLQITEIWRMHIEVWTLNT